MAPVLKCTKLWEGGNHLVVVVEAFAGLGTPETESGEPGMEARDAGRLEREGGPETVTGARGGKPAVEEDMTGEFTVAESVEGAVALALEEFLRARDAEPGRGLEP